VDTNKEAREDQLSRILDVYGGVDCVPSQIARILLLDARLEHSAHGDVVLQRRGGGVQGPTIQP
jgi:transcriptional regulator CtsR